MSSRLMIVLATIGVAGFSLAGSALADPYHGTDEGSNYDRAIVSPYVYGTGYAARGGVNEWGYESQPRYYGGPKSPY
jgi:hypothetical protein